MTKSSKRKLSFAKKSSLVAATLAAATGFGDGKAYSNDAFPDVSEMSSGQATATHKSSYGKLATAGALVTGAIGTLYMMFKYNSQDEKLEPAGKKNTEFFGRDIEADLLEMSDAFGRGRIGLNSLLKQPGYVEEALRQGYDKNLKPKGKKNTEFFGRDIEADLLEMPDAFGRGRIGLNSLLKQPAYVQEALRQGYGENPECAAALNAARQP